MVSFCFFVFVCVEGGDRADIGELTFLIAAEQEVEIALVEA